MNTKVKYRLRIFTFLLGLFYVFTTSAQQKEAKGGYGDMLYPFVHDYDQTLAFKICVDDGKKEQNITRNAGETLEVIKRIDNLTRGIPKIVYLVGWQYSGHDTGYPSFLKVNPLLKRENDNSALESLRWLMREAPKFHTLVSLHLNFSDCYLDDNPLGPKYKERDIIARETDGRHRKGFVWSNHQAYWTSNYRNWYQGTFRTEQIDPLLKMIPELKMSGSLHPDAWICTDNPYYQVDSHMDCLAMREMTVYLREKYNMDITTEFDFMRPEGEDFVLYHPMIWHIGWNQKTPPAPLKIPSYFMTGGDTYLFMSDKPSDLGKFFGQSATLESEINENPLTIPGGLKSFATNTLPWYFLNRQLRNRFNGDTAWFSGGVMVSYPDKRVIKQNGNLLQDGNNVFIPALWKSQPEIIAYSETGYQAREWKLPESWNKVKKVDIYSIKPEGLSLVEKKTKVLLEGTVKLSLDAGQGLVIVPAGNDPDKEIENISSGQVSFAGTDTQTKGSWQGKYGSDGYYIPGAGEKIQKNTEIGFINGKIQTWKNKTRDVQAIQIPGEEENIAAARSHPLHEIIDFNFEDGKEHDVAIYFLDWDRQGRWAVVDIIDPDSRKILHSYNLTDFEQGVYLKYKMKGRLQCRITNVYTQRYQKSPDAGFSAIFFNSNN